MLSNFEHLNNPFSYLLISLSSAILYHFFSDFVSRRVRIPLPKSQAFSTFFNDQITPEMLLVLIVNIQKQDGSEKTTIIEIQDNEEVAVLQQMIQFEGGLSPAEQVITFNNSPVQLRGLISQSGIQNNANLIVKQIAARPVQSNVRNTIPKDATPEVLIEFWRTHPHLIEEITEQDPAFGGAIKAGDVGKLRGLMMMRHLKNHEQGFKRQQEQMEIERDPDNPEHQRKIAEAIRMLNVQQNMELAIDELPESFGRIHMLYVNITINDSPLKAFVDSGAQSTIMSQMCAERVGIMRLLDTRYAGEARGVGTAKILGRVHIAQMKFGSTYLPVSITILASNDVDFLFGLDTLRRYRCVIDLGRNVLRIDGSNGPEELEFLSENDTGPTALFSDQPSSSSAASSGGETKPAATGTAAAGGAGGDTMEVDSSNGNSSATAAASNGAPVPDGALSPEAKIQQLISMGFSKGESELALGQAEGDVNLAATLLFSSR